MFEYTQHGCILIATVCTLCLFQPIYEKCMFIACINHNGLVPSSALLIYTSANVNIVNLNDQVISETKVLVCRTVTWIGLG